MVSSSAISDILTNPDATGRVAKWVIELGPWDIKYAHLKAIKAQVLPDFTTEWIQAQLPSVPDLSNAWTMYFDGSKKYDGAGAGVILISPKGDNSATYYRWTSRDQQIMRRSMRHSSMVCGWPRTAEPHTL